MVQIGVPESVLTAVAAFRMEKESRPLSCWRFFERQSRSIRVERPEWLSGCGGLSARNENERC
ncbi:hypothetical protein DMI77_00230 [Akkermansia muciniphila]|nr:hypothetical protein CXU18_02380 [Akkermansia muciniphila]QUY58221.1 hypothetical protein DMI77_00230 [Akkermansia muciniphila]